MPRLRVTELVWVVPQLAAMAQGPVRGESCLVFAVPGIFLPRLTVLLVASRVFIRRPDSQQVDRIVDLHMERDAGHHRSVRATRKVVALPTGIEA